MADATVKISITRFSDIWMLVFQPPMMQTHAVRFSALLYAEELQMELDMREFDLQHVNICFWFPAKDVFFFKFHRSQCLLIYNIGVCSC
jgi:hypothetical protein